MFLVPAAAEAETRKTLMQWSYGTSFEGGPDRSEPLISDRPDFTESSVTVGQGVCQLEMGYTYTYDNDDTAANESHSYPETLLRVGMLAEWFELRLAWNVGQVTDSIFDTPPTTANGAEDMVVGFKIALTPQEGILPETAFLGDASFPTGSDEFTADEVLPGGALLYGWDLCDWLATAGQTRFDRALDDETLDPYLEVSQSWTLGISLTERVGSYVEWYAFFPHSADTNRNQHYLNGGFTVLANNDLQWDIRAGMGLNEAADDYFTGTGLVVRW
jgi:hypothetical protein